MPVEQRHIRQQSFRDLLATALIALLITATWMSPASARGTVEYDVARLQSLVNSAHQKYKDLKDGANANYIPILDTVPSDLFGVVIVTNDGQIFAAGDVDYAFSIQSVSKPFTAALVMQQQGTEALQQKIGVEPTGMPFNSKLAIELISARSVNPLVNAGAIAAVSMVEADSQAQRWNRVLDNLSGFAGTRLRLLEEVYQSEYSTAWSNRAIANLLFNYGRLYSEPEEALIVYTRQCSVGVTARQLGIMGATLSNNGVNPVTGKRMLAEEYVPKLLAVMLTAGFYDESGLWAYTAGLPAKTGVGGGIVAVMLTAGFYDESGLWAYTAGLPAKTGVGGGIVAVVPGELAIAAFSPRLNNAGNSIRAMKAIQYISGELGANIFLGR